MFSNLLVVGMLCAGQVAPASAVEETRSRSASTARPFHEIHKQLRSALRSEATTKDDSEYVASVVELTRLYGEIVRDDRLATSRVLESYRAKLRYRLLQVQKRMQRELDRRGNQLDGPQDQIMVVQRMLEPYLALQLPLTIGPGVPIMLIVNGGGGPTGARGGAARSDYGPILVDLIQRTIAPDFWNVNGGPGVIVYYRLWYALVVRATSEVHGSVGRLTGGLRKGR